ncbi:AEC family transporter [Cytobacillus purgationiresistens]|uniref:Permease n=1 Tax=Cytobacillus purgationiresistens TaxID=863449 RepID=A0ABU0ANF2_9BACI|nr:AEC family transporter [Cytobacillus purgationiresistens]MDQ0272817.1 putative permease [Cytobacillus purgationiresistens]
MDAATVTLAITTMGIIILFGAIVAYKIAITTEAKNLFMAIIINIAVPFIILNGVFNTEMTDEVLQQVLIIFGVSIAINTLAVFISLAMGRLLGFQLSLAKKLALLAALGNTGFIAIPLCATLFGPIGGLLAAVFDAGLDVVLFSLGVYILQSEQRFHIRQLKALLNMPLLAITVGLLYVVSGMNAPVIFQDIAAMLSGLAAPLAMLYIGFLLPPFFKKGHALFYRELWFPLLMKLIIFPGITVLILSLIPIDDFLKQILVILTAMPTFMLASVLFSRYSNEENKAVMTTVYSTLLSLITIPLITLFAAYFF